MTRSRSEASAPAAVAALAEVEAATAARSEAERTWREAVRSAVAAGVPVIAIAAAAGVSRERVYQVRDGRR